MLVGFLLRLLPKAAHSSVQGVRLGGQALMETLIRFFLVALMVIVAAGLFLMWASNRWKD